MTNALIIIDMQNDFFPGGALPVSKAPEVLPSLNRLLEIHFDFIIATKDWHPENHISFAANHNKKPGEKISMNGKTQMLWPIHCVQGTTGSDFHPGWNTDKINKIILKGDDSNIDSYSAFFDNYHEKSTGLSEYLHSHNINEVYIAGLATDYCVKFSVLDSLAEGFKTYVIQDACQGVNIHPDDSDKAIEEMRQHGAIIISSKEI